MALQEFAWVDPGSNLGKAVEKTWLLFLKFKLIINILSKAKINTNNCNPTIGGIFVSSYK